MSGSLTRTHMFAQRGRRRLRNITGPSAALLTMGLLLEWSAPVKAVAPFVTLIDPACDVVARPSDPGADGVFDPDAHRLIELRETTLGNWTPVDAETDLFTGSFSSNGVFLRLDLVVDGLVNPPGDTRPQTFQPFAFGDHPIYGFVEIDMDVDNNTGGELLAPQYRYLGNIVRFGGVPEDDIFVLRVAQSGSAFDQDFVTQPWVERHGEEFHIALLGGGFGIQNIAVVSGDGDLVFEVGETWDIEASWFHRAHGFEPFSVAVGGAVPGNPLR